MDAIIMAGGEGSRLKSVTGDTPKPLATVAGKPVLEHVLRRLADCGVQRACLTLRYRPELIMERFGDGSELGLRLEYRIEERPLGTAGGVRACADFYGNRDFLVLSGDAIFDFDLRVLTEAHRRHRPAATLALDTRSEPLRFGTVLTARDGRIVSFVEKPGWTEVVSDLVNTGIYVLSPGAMERVPEGVPFDFGRDLFPALLRDGELLLGLPMEGYWCDIGTPRDYYRCNLDALEGRVRLAGGSESSPGTGPRPTADPRDTRELPCRSRARLMRSLAGALMEAGADFDLGEGLTLRMGGQHVNIAPSERRESLLLRGEGTHSAALERDCAALLRRLEGI